MVAYKAEGKKTLVINDEKIKNQALNVKEIGGEGIMVLWAGRKILQKQMKMSKISIGEKWIIEKVEEL